MSKLEDLATEDYQNRGDAYPKSNVPVTIVIYDKEVVLSFKNTDEETALKWSKSFVIRKGFTIVEASTAQDGDYHDDWVNAHVMVKESEIN